jgi:hypothetical protein
MIEKVKYANRISYTDVSPYEIIEERTNRKLIVRAMEATLDKSNPPVFVKGGFGATCVNQAELRYSIESSDKYPLIAIRLHKDGWWRDADGNKFRLDDIPLRFYDFNF